MASTLATKVAARMIANNEKRRNLEEEARRREYEKVKREELEKIETEATKNMSLLARLGEGEEDIRTLFSVEEEVGYPYHIVKKIKVVNMFSCYDMEMLIAKSPKFASVVRWGKKNGFTLDVREHGYTKQGHSAYVLVFLF